MLIIETILMETMSTSNPHPPITYHDILQTGFTLGVRLPWTIITTILRRWWPSTYQPPPLKEHLFRHVMTCLGNHLPNSLWRRNCDTSPDKLTTSTRYAHLPQICQPVNRPHFSGTWLCRGLSIDPISPRDADVVIFHCHGGGYVVGHPYWGATSRLFLAEMLQKQGLTTAIFSLDYTLTPEAVFPTQVEEAVAAYDWLRKEEGVDARRIVVLGDSAGGHLVLALLVALARRREGRVGSESEKTSDCPAAAVLLSPWVNLHSSNPRTLALHWEERLFKISLDKNCEMLMRGVPGEVQHAYGNFAQREAIRGSWKEILPSRTWVSAGSEELVFRYDIEDFVTQAQGDGADVILEVTEGKDHAWQCAEASGHEEKLLGMGMDEDDASLMGGYRRIAHMIMGLMDL